MIDDKVRNSSLSIFEPNLENHILTRHTISLNLFQVTLKASAVYLDHILSLIVEVLNETFEVFNEVTDEIFLDFAHCLIILLINNFDFVRKL